MPAEFRWIFTPAGLAKRASAEAGGELLAPAQFAVGDGGGVYHEPEELVGGLINEVWRGPVNRIYVHPAEVTLVMIEAKIPPEEGGFDIREAAIIDAGGDIIAVGKYPQTEKPAAGSGGEKEIYVRGGIRVSNGGDVVLQIDASLAMATQQYVDDHAERTDNPHQVTAAQAGADPAGTAAAAVGVHAAAADPHPQYETSTEAQAKVNAAVAALVASSPAALDTLNELAAALGDDPNFAATVMNALAAKAALGGNALQQFLVAAATTAGHATRLDQFSFHPTYIKIPCLYLSVKRTFIIQMVQFNIGNLDSGGVAIPVTFPITFPTACLGILGSAKGNTGSNDIAGSFYAGFSNETTSGATLVFDERAGIAQNITGFYVAIGW